MYTLDEYTLWKDYKLNREPVVVAATEKHRMLSEAGLIRRPWLSCQICRSLWRIGRSLATTGHWLERRYGAASLQPQVDPGC